MFDSTLSDPSALKRLSNILQWVAIGLVFCGGFVQVLRFVVDQREKAVSRAQSLEKEQQQQEREAALRADLEKSKSDLEAVATRDIFRPLAAEVRAPLVASLRELQRGTTTTPLKLSVYVEAGSRNRILLRVELLEILREAGFDATEDGVGTTFPNGPLPAVSFHLSEASLPLANALAERLSLFVKTDWQGSKADTPLGDIAIQIYGDPQFDSQGIVTFR